MNRVEIQIVKDKKAIKQIDYQCFLSKNLYNYCNYILRQSFIKTGKIPNQYELVNKLTKRNNKDFRSLPSNVSQQVVYLLYKNWKSFFESLKSYKKNPKKFLSCPKVPKYKKKDGRNCLIFTSVTCRIKNGEVNFVRSIIPKFKTKVEAKGLVQVRVVPEATCYKVEVVYKIEKEKICEINENYLGIDIGLNNLATCINSVDGESFIINGRTLKSINQCYNKQKACLQSKLAKGVHTSKRIKRVTLKRNNQINDYIHKASKYIVKYCLENNISNIIIGHNKGWKQKNNFGKIGNQNFVSVPFNNLIQKIAYKAEEVGINLIIHEESYTSKIDHFVFEPMKHHEKYLGKRVHRGLFKSSTGKIINADVNGSIGIMRKVIGDSFINRIVDSGLMLNPIKINTF